MKNILKIAIAFSAAATMLVACHNDDSVLNNFSGTGNLGVEFDNSFAGNDLMLNSANSATSNNEVLKITSVKYIVSNIVLYNEYGVLYTYPKATGYFIVNEADESTHVLELTNIPAGNYTRIKFGIGVDQSQYDLGEAGQGSIHEMAVAENMIESWTEGYNFMSLSGTFTSTTVADANFNIKVKKTDSGYNYREVVLDLPQQALVRATITPEIHIIADLSKVIDGTHKIKLSDTPDISDGTKVVEVSENLLSIFSVAHVHNE